MTIVKNLVNSYLDMETFLWNDTEMFFELRADLGVWQTLAAGMLLRLELEDRPEKLNYEIYGEKWSTVLTASLLFIS